MRNRARFRNDSRIITSALSTTGSTLSSISTKNVTSFETMTDFLTPGWRNPDRSSFPINPLTYACSSDTESPKNLVFSVFNFPNWVRVNGLSAQFLTTAWNISWPQVVLNGYDLTFLTNLAKNEALGKMDNPEYSFAEPLAEVRQTLQLIRNPLRSLKRLLNSFNRKAEPIRTAAGNRRSAVNRSKALSDLWLSYSVGARPLVRTTSDAIDSFARRAIEKRFPTFRRATDTQEFTGTGFSKATVNSAFPYSGGYTVQSWTHTRNQNRFLRANITAGLYYRSLDENTTASYLGLRARDIPELAWDLFPLSFLVDRLYNVKRFLSVSSKLLSSKVRMQGGWVSIRVSDRYTRSINDIFANGVNIYNNTYKCRPTETSKWTREEFIYSRSKWNPTAFDALPPTRAGRLLGSLSSTSDAVSILIGKIL
jgi:hypothetical protein